MSQLTRTARKKKNIGHPERRTLFFAPAAGIDVTGNIGKRGFAAVSSPSRMSPVSAWQPA
jgi:hypothetical protein